MCTVCVLRRNLLSGSSDVVCQCLTHSSATINMTFLCFPACSEVHLTQQRLPCSGEEVVFQCTLPGGAVIWKFPGKEITLAPGSRDEVTGNFRAHPVGVVNRSFTSTLTFPAENGTVITCINGLDRSMNSTKRVRVQGNITFHNVIPVTFTNCWSH